MNQSPETPKTEPLVTWEIINPEKLPEILDHTIEETIFQSAARADTGTQLLRIIPPQNTDKWANTLEILGKATSETVLQLRQLQNVFRQDPGKPVPIDHRYGNEYPIIALNLVGSDPQQTS